MSFSYYDKDKNIKKLDIKVGMNWSELKTDNEKLNSVFGQIDDGDGIVQFTEKMLLEDIASQIDYLGGEETGNDKTLQQDELKYYSTDNAMLQLKFKKEYFSLETLKHAFPEDKFEYKYEDDSKTFGEIINKETGKEVLHFDFDEENNGYTINEYTANGNIYSIKNNEETTYFDIVNKGKDKSKNYSFTFHNDTMTSFENEEKSEYFYGQDEIQSKMYYDQFNDPEWIQNEGIDFFDNVDNEFLTNFINEYHFYNPYLGILDQIAKCDAIPQKKRNEFISRTLERLEKEYGYKKELSIKDSQIDNQFYKSKNSYDIEYKNDIITIKNNTKEAEPTIIDLNKLLNQVPLDIQPKIKAELQKLPAEVLIDLSIECDEFNKPVKHQRGHAGLYNSFLDRIAIGLGKIENITAYTITHELGHAIDNREALTIFNKDDFEYQLIQLGRKRGEIPHTKIMSSKANKRLKNAYEIAKFKGMGLEKYLKIDSNSLEYSLDKTALEQDGYTKNGKWTEKYNKREDLVTDTCYMFTELTEAPSELYCAAMLGSFDKEDANSNITPELMEEFLKDLKRVRSLSQDERHTR